MHHVIAITSFSLLSVSPLLLLLLCCTTSFIYWIAFGMHRTSSAGISIVVLRTRKLREKGFELARRGARLRVASRRRRYCVQRCVGNPISYFLDRKLNLVAERPTTEVAKLGKRLIGDTIQLATSRAFSRKIICR